MFLKYLSESLRPSWPCNRSEVVKINLRYNLDSEWAFMNYHVQCVVHIHGLSPENISHKKGDPNRDSLNVRIRKRFFIVIPQQPTYSARVSFAWLIPSSAPSDQSKSPPSFFYWLKCRFSQSRLFCLSRLIGEERRGLKDIRSALFATSRLGPAPAIAAVDLLATVQPQTPGVLKQGKSVCYLWRIRLFDCLYFVVNNPPVLVSEIVLDFVRRMIQDHFWIVLASRDTIILFWYVSQNHATVYYDDRC